jgi:hypothetical protein
MHAHGDHVDNTTFFYGEEAPHRVEDKPFNPSLSLRDAEGLMTAWGLPKCINHLVHQAAQSLLANLMKNAQTGNAECVFYARDINHYTGLNRYHPRFYRRWNIVAAVEYLEREGLIEHERTRPSPSARYRSRVRASARLLALMPRLAGTVLFRPREVLVLRNSDGMPISYRDTAQTLAIRDDVSAHNSFMEGIEITVEHVEARYDEHDFLIVGKQRIDPTRKTYCRVYNCGLERGGRWYGPWFQRLTQAAAADTAA